MIDKKPTPGNWTDLSEEAYSGDGLYAQMVHDVPPVRTSSILGPDGNPMQLDIPRRKIGFDLRRKAKA